MMLPMKLLVSVVILIVLLASFTTAQSKSPYKLATTINVGGEGGWEYITYDAGTNSLFLAHGTEIAVVDVSTGKKRGSVPADGAHGIAIVPAKSLAFSTNGRANTVTVFDAKTLQVKDQIKVGDHPDAIMYDEYANKVVVMNGHSKDLMAIDPDTLKVVATVPLGGSPEVAVADSAHVYVNVEDTGETVEVDSKSWKPGSHWKLEGCEDPSGLVLDDQTNHLYSSCGNKKMVVVDKKSGKVLASVDTGAGTDGEAFDPGLGYALSPNGADGTLTVVSVKGGKYKAVAQVPTRRGARTIALDPKSHKVFLPTAEYGPPVEGQRRPPIKPDTFAVLVFEPAS